MWADLGDAAPNGICLDAEGAAWYADVPHQHCVRVAEGGQRLATVPLDRGGFDCVLGGTDGKTLYVVAARWPGMAGLGGDAPWRVKYSVLRSLFQARGRRPLSEPRAVPKSLRDQEGAAVERATPNKSASSAVLYSPPLSRATRCAS